MKGKDAELVIRLNRSVVQLAQDKDQLIQLLSYLEEMDKSSPLRIRVAHCSMAIDRVIDELEGCREYMKTKEVVME